MLTCRYELGEKMKVVLGYRVKFEVQVDEEDIDLATEFYWGSRYGYAVRPGSDKHYFGNKPFHKQTFLHRAIAERMLGVETILGHQIDHVNGDRSDNRRDNLRLVKQAENSQNAAKQSGTSSPYKGVSWSRPTGKWRSYIKLDGKQKHLGLYRDPVEAAKAYDQAARSHFGAYACVNFPLTGERGAI